MKARSRASALAGALGLILLAFAGAAQSQYTNYMRPGVNFNNLYAAQADITLSNMMRQSQMIGYLNSVKASQAKAAGRAPPVASPPPPAAVAAVAPKRPLSATDFRPAGARDTAQQMSAAVADPAGRAQMVQVFRQIQETLEGTPGFRRNNLASAVTVLLGVSLQVLTGKEFDDAQSQGLLQLVNDELAALPGFKALSNEKRTRMYDAMVMTGGLIAGIAHNAAEAGDEAQALQARTMALDALASLGLKP